MDVGKKNREFIEEKVEVILYSRRVAVFGIPGWFYLSFVD
jgi:hypothetical protein